MAGFYADVPAPRMAYDRDGSVAFKLNHPGTGGPAVVLDQSARQALNSEGPNGVSFTSWNTESTGVIFPELRDVTGITLQALQGSNTDWSLNEVSTSPDTTNGVDGNWTVRAGVSKSNAPENPAYRQNVNIVNWPGIKAVRWRCSSGGSGGRQANAHIYGAISSIGSEDTLRMWHPTLDEPLDDSTSADGAYLDWGDVVRGTTADRTFRVKNNSATLTANSVNVSTQVLTNTTPTIESAISYSDGGTFDPSINIGNLAPGAISSVITVRKATNIIATLNVWTWRTNAEATSWT